MKIPNIEPNNHFAGVTRPEEVQVAKSTGGHKLSRGGIIAIAVVAVAAAVALLAYLAFIVMKRRNEQVPAASGVNASGGSGRVRTPSYSTTTLHK